VKSMPIMNIAAILFAGVAHSAEKPVALKEAPGLDKVEANCAACHSLDYIQMNSPFLPAEKWDAEVTKMIRVMGAQISEADAKEIADYLKQNYGEQSAAK
jgi:mono/diheme cytochrome c family protein